MTTRACSRLALILSLALAACGDDDPPAVDAPPAVPDAAQGTPDAAEGDPDAAAPDAGGAPDGMITPPLTGTCAMPIVLGDPGSASGDTTGRPSEADGSCQVSEGVGADVVYQVTVTTTGVLDITLISVADLGVYVRTACGDPVSEVGCIDEFGGDSTELLTVPVTAGDVVYVFVDAWSEGDESAYTLGVASRELLPETECTNLVDDDGDLRVDCGDTDCAPTPACVPGTGVTGAPCSASTDCASDASDPLCFDEPLAGWPSGVCSQFCDVGGTECGTNGYCRDSAYGGFCVETCTTAADCTSAGYGCVAYDTGVNICIPACTSDAQCVTTGTCDELEGICRRTEICDNAGDDDVDGLTDCEDPMCDGHPACGATCTFAGTLVDGVTTMGNTLGAGAEVLPSCGVPGGEDLVYTYAPGTVGQRGVSSISVTASGEVALAVRTDCEDSSSDIACSFDDATSAAVDLLVLGGEPLVVIVDTVGWMGGPVTLTSTFTPDVCNDGVVTGWEGCEDGNTTDGDGCSSLCEYEVGPICAAAPMLLSPEMGDTTGGTAAFEGSCTGGDGAFERVYTYTPGVTGESGTLELQLVSATDQGIYVRSDCDDELTELGSIDELSGGIDETLVLGGVTGGVPLTIFVDGSYDPTFAGPFTLTATWTPDGP